MLLLTCLTLLTLLASCAVICFAGAGTAIEHPDLKLLDRQGAQFNFELNNKCALTKACGSACFLNTIQPDAPEIPDALRLQAVHEIMDAGPKVRHLSLVGKEPTESPALLRDILEEYHSRPYHRRPQAIGMITHGLHLRSPRLDFLSDTSLDWCLTSLDGIAQTHKRGLQLWSPAFEGLMHIKRTGGSKVVGVNTVIDGNNTDSAIRLGQLLRENGVRYHGLGVMMGPVDGVMASLLSPEQTREAYLRVCEAYAGDTDMHIRFEMSPEAFSLIGGEDPARRDERAWRLEHHEIGTPVVAVCPNPRPGLFYRLRFNGDLLSWQDFLTPQIIDTAYGTYQPGRISDLLGKVTPADSACAPRDLLNPGCHKTLTAGATA